MIIRYIASILRKLSIQNMHKDQALKIWETLVK